MKWRNTCFKDKDIAELCRNELAEAGIKVGDVFLNDERWYVPWMPMSKAEYEAGVHVVCQHIW